MASVLSKSKYCTGLQCPKLLWIHYNDKEQLPPWDDSVQARFDQGHTIGELAKSLYPGGIEIEFRRDAFAEMIAETTDALNQRKPIFEATFSHGGGYAQADVLVPAEGDAWDIVEVKSSTSVKNVYLNDIAFQLRLYESAGLSINRCFVMHVNNQYVRQGDIEVGKLLTKEDVTGEARKRSDTVRMKMDQMFETIALPECPEMEVGPHCSNPYDCPLAPECWSFLPEHPIGSLYRFSSAKESELRENGIHAIEDLPHNYTLTARQKIQRATLLSGTPHINHEAIAKFLDGFSFPQYHLDFETSQIPIPPYDNSRPYQHIPFQYSLHIWESFESEPRHIEFLADGKTDPRPNILKTLKESIGPDGDIIAYNIGFEKMCLKHSAKAFPEYQSFVDQLLPRFVDLITPFRAFDFYHPEQHGSASIKKVLPVLVPELSYAELEIGDGLTARNEYTRVTFGEVSGEERARVRAALREYCHLDTLAMIRIIQALVKLA